MGIEERLSRLERENRTLKRGFLALALGAVALVLMGQAAPRAPQQPALIPPFLRIKRLEIIGDNGVPVVILGQHKSFGHVAVANPLGRALVSLGTTRSGKGFVSTYDGGDTRLASIGASAQGAGVVTTYNAKGKSQIRIGDSPKREGSITLYNQEGRVKTRWPQD